MITALQTIIILEILVPKEPLLVILGGAKEVALTNQQMPIHKHAIDFMTTGDIKHTHSKTTNNQASQDGDGAVAWNATDAKSANLTVHTDESG